MAKLVFWLRREAAESPERYRMRLAAWKKARGWLTDPQDPPRGFMYADADCRQSELALVVQIPVVEKAS